MTFIASAFAPAGIVLASDSRSVKIVKGTRDAPDDSVYKTFVTASNLGVGIAGNYLPDNFGETAGRYLEKETCSASEPAKICNALRKLAEEATPGARSGKFEIHILIAGYKDSTPYIYTCQANEGQENDIVQNNKTADSGYAFIGNSKAIIEESRKHSLEVITKKAPPDSKSTIEALSVFAEACVAVTASHKESDGFVGGPIDLLKITQAGPEWLRRK